MATIGKKKRPSEGTMRNTKIEEDEATLNRYCKDINEWSDAWAGFPHLDRPVGRGIVAEFKPFLLDLIKRNRAQSTVQRYALYLWALGGELIRHVNTYEADRNLSARRLILDHVNDTGGPWWPHARDRHQQDAYHSGCIRLFKFMTATDPLPTNLV